MDAVSEVLVARSTDKSGLGSMLSASVVAHVVLIGLFMFFPAAWLGVENTVPETVMQISLGGPIGPNDGGLNTLGARPVQELAETTKAISPVRPPAVKTPEMIVPTKEPPKKTPPTKAEAKDPKSNTPTKGQAIEKGTAVAETKARGQGFGLSSGGGGDGAFLEVANFCCPEYLATMRRQILANWDSRQGAAGRVHMRFVIQRDGRIVDVTVEETSGVQTLDLYARRALTLTKLPRLPEAYTEPALAVHLYFDYRR